MLFVIWMSCDPLVWSCDPQGQATDIAIQAEEIVKLKKLLNELLSKHTGQPIHIIGT